MLYWAIVLAIVAAAPAQSYNCGSIISGDCQSEYNNARRNGNMGPFYRRCRTEGGSQPLRKRCSLCCKEDEPEAPAPPPAPAPAPAKPPAKPQGPAPGDYECGDTISGDCQREYDNSMQNWGTLGPFYRRCENEGGARPLRARCSLCCGDDEPEPTTALPPTTDYVDITTPEV